MRRRLARTSLLGLLVLASFADAAEAGNWDAIPPGELIAGAPRVDADSDAEIVHWSIEAEDVVNYTTGQIETEIRQHRRTRVFTERGKEIASRVEIDSPTGTRILRVEARTVLPDGRTVPLRSTDVFQKTLVRVGRLRLQRTSFAFPGVVPGAVLEYRWSELRSFGANLLLLQDRLPVQTLVVRFRPLVRFTEFRYVVHRTPFHRLNRVGDGYYEGTLRNVPAWREEPMMPPALEVRPWILGFYVTRSESPSEYWKSFAFEAYESDRLAMSRTPALEACARRWVGDATRDEEKLERLYEHCASEIRNLSRRPEEDGEKLSKPRNLDEVLSRGEGTTDQINFLFASLANALGFQARIARTSDKETTFFEETSLLPGLLCNTNVAVRTASGWSHFDPGEFGVPFGMLPWQEEGQRGIVPDPSMLIWTNTPASPTKASTVRRLADVTLEADGALEGDVMIEYRGHLGIEEKNRYADLDRSGREHELQKLIRVQMPLAEVSQVRFQNVDTRVHPVTIRFHLRVPDFAQVTGRRLFFQPAVFQKGRAPQFTGQQRIHPITVPYAWAEYDSLLIHIPDGYAFEDPRAPAALGIGEVGEYRVRMGIADQGRLLVYRREFQFENVRFDPGEFPALRDAFDALRERDDRPLAIQRVQAGGN